jgi:pSer/pThr/pTyr-binding forkhead associated (FHA) protein
VSLIDRLAQTAYEAHRAALPTRLPEWQDITQPERQAWRAAVSAVAGEVGGTIPEPPPNARSLTLQLGDQHYTFGTDFTVGREGSIAIDDDFISEHHARFQTVRGLWYVEDLGSTNGTLLNGRHVLSVQLLKRRDKIQIGHTVITVKSVLATRAATAAPKQAGGYNPWPAPVEPAAARGAVAGTGGVSAVTGGGG